MTHSKTFYELSDELAQASSQEEKDEVLRQFSVFLSGDKEMSEALLRNALLHSLEATSAGRLVIDSEFYTLRQRVYRDEDGLYKVAVGVAFVQNMASHDAELESRLLSEILRSLEAMGMQSLVNDISVNGLQLRNGSSDSLL